MTKIQARLEEVESEATAAKEEAATLREVRWENYWSNIFTFGLLQVRDEVVKDRGDVQRRLDVLTEFFNKKEAELQKQLGLQSAKWDNTMRGWCDLNFHTFPGLATCPLMLRALQGSWFLWPQSWTALGLRCCRKIKVIQKENIKFWGCEVKHCKKFSCHLVILTVSSARIVFRQMI